MFYFLLTLLFSFFCLAEDDSALDRYHRFASKGLVGLSSSIDYFFGRFTIDDELNGTYARLTYTSRFVESEDAERKFRFRVRVDLPGTKKRLKLIIDDNSEENESGNNQARSITDTTGQENEGLNAALRFIVEQRKNWNINLDTGMKIRIGNPLDPFLRLRARRSFFFNDWELRAVQEIYEFARRSTVSTSILDLDHPITNNLLFRYGNGAEWTNENDYFNFSTGPTLFHQMTDEKALSYNIKASGNNRFQSTFTSYDFFVTYRQLLYKDWVYLQLTPGIQYPKIKNFERTPFVIIQFQALVGNFK